MRIRSQHEPGAVLIFAVLLLGAGVFVLTGIAQLAATQAVVSQDEWQALQRRNMLENSRSMARQFMLARMFRGVVSTNVGYTNASLGGFSLIPGSTAGIADYWTTPTEDDATLNLKINPFTPMERGGFYRVVVPAKLTDEVTVARTNEVDWNFQVRTRSPIAAGYSFAQQLPVNNNLAGLVPAGVPYVDMFTPEKFIGFADVPRMPVSSVTNTNPDPTGYAGYMAIPLVPGGSSYGLYTNQRYEPRDASLTSLQIVLDLSLDNPSDTNSVILFNMLEDVADYATNAADGTPVVYSNLPVQAIVLKGSDTPTAKPLHVVVGPSITNTSVLVLSNNNERLVYFNRQKQSGSAGIFDVISVNASSYRLGMTVSKAGVQFQIDTLEVKGGLRTDGGITFQGGEAYFVPEDRPEGLDYIADRMMWLEDYKTP